MVSNISLVYPKIDSKPFERNNVFIKDDNNEESTNNTKEMYMKD